MKIAKIATVSTITLGIAMSAAALSAGPSLAQEGPRLQIQGKQTCVTGALPLPAAGTAVDTGLVIDFKLGKAKPVQLIFSTELAFTAMTGITLSYSIDGVLPPVPIGPAGLVRAANVGPETRNAYAVTASLPKGKHTITPFLTSDLAATATAGSRCFAVLNTGR